MKIKKNSRNGHNLSNNDINSSGFIINSDKYEPAFIIPPPYRAWCHPCDLGFMTIDDMTRHWAREHMGKQK